jgi:AraC-like DNA-binding protein
LLAYPWVYPLTAPLPFLFGPFLWCSVSFRDLLNSWRLDYFLDRIQEGAHEGESLLEIAFDAGFPSKSTFNRVFKDKMGVSPSEFITAKDLS